MNSPTEVSRCNQPAPGKGHIALLCNENSESQGRKGYARGGERPAADGVTQAWGTQEVGMPSQGSTQNKGSH